MADLHRSKKGFFFLIDATLAVITIIIGVIIIYDSFFGEPTMLQLNILANSVIVLYSNTTVEQVDVAGINGWVNGCSPCIIDDDSVTFAQQLVKFYINDTQDNSGYMRAFVGNVTGVDFPKSLDFVMKLNNTVIYNTTDPAELGKTVIPARTSVIYIDRDQNIYGPYLLEVLVW